MTDTRPAGSQAEEDAPQPALARANMAAAAQPTHSPLEDAIALVTGSALVSLAIALHSHVSILTGGTAGLALLLQYSAGVPFAVGFFVINLPFYARAVLRLGWPLALRTVVGVTVVSILAKFTPDWLAIRTIDPIYSSLIGGVLLGVGRAATTR